MTKSKPYEFSVVVKLQLLVTAVIVIVVLMVGLIQYFYMTDKILADEINSRKTILRITQKSVDSEIGYLNNLTFKLSLDDRADAISYYYPENMSSKYPGNILSAVDLQLFLSNEAVTNGLLNMVGVYFVRSQVFLSNEARYDNIYLENLLAMVSPKTSLEELEKTRNPRLQFLGQYTQTAGRPLLVFARNLPVTEEKPRYIAFLVVDKSKIDLFPGQGINEDSSAYVMILDEKNQVVAGPDGGDFKKASDYVVENIEKLEGNAQTEYQFDADGKEYIAVYAVSEINGWKYISIIPKQEILRSITNIRTTTFFILLCCIAAGFITSWILSRRLYRPIQKIMDFIAMHETLDGKRNRFKDEFASISRFINRIFKDYQQSEEAFAENLPVLRENFLLSILNGAVDRGQLSRSKEILGLKLLEDQEFLIAVCEISGQQMYRPRTPAGHILNEAIEKYGGTLYMVQRNEGLAILIFNYDLTVTDPAEPYEFLVNIAREMEAQGTICTIGVGEVHKGIENVTISYMEALRALKCKMVKAQNSVIMYGEIVNLRDGDYSYPLETEQQIINATKTGNWEKLCRTLEDVKNVNLSRASISPEAVSGLFNAIASTAMRVLQDSRVSLSQIMGEDYNIYRLLSECRTAEGQFKLILNLFEKISRYLTENKRDQNIQVYNKIRDYIHAHYDRDISLTTVSESLGISIQYISWIFKETSGVNFLDYLNSYRIEQAQKLLRESTMGIAEIGSQVGFGTTNNFIRVFKKYTGQTPGQYRSSAGQKT